MINRIGYAPTPAFPMEMLQRVSAAADEIQESDKSEHECETQEYGEPTGVLHLFDSFDWNDIKSSLIKPHGRFLRRDGERFDKALYTN